MENQTTIHDGEPKRGNSDDHEYDAYIARIAQRFTRTVEEQEPLFTTDAYKHGNTALWDAYLLSFPPEERQFHNCSACRHFIQRFGSLVTIKDGRTAPAVWNEEDAPDLYKPAVAAMARLVRRAKVTGVFLSEAVELGQAQTRTEICTWHHFAVRNPRVFKRTTKTAKQAMAEKREDRNTVARALAEFTPSMLQTAVTLLKTDALYRSEKVLGAAEWLLETAEQRRTLTGELRENALWRAIANSHAGYCHPRSSMIGTLLEDIEAGLPYEDVRRKFAAKMAPLAYQRPQAAPSAGNIAVAERLVEKLGIGPSLRRRFARLDDVLEKLWTPETQPDALVTKAGVFGHLTPKGETTPETMRIPPQVLTWEKFARTVLPTARKLEVLTPMRGTFSALVTAVDPEAPPILQWDSPERRNPVSWYLYQGGSFAARWGLSANTWVDVTAITLQPSQWFGGTFAHQGEGALFIMKGCSDLEWQTAGLGIFPETLRSELREVRSTIEAHSKSGTIEGHEQAGACGIKIKKGQRCEVVARATDAKGITIAYQIDRWD